MTLEKQRGFSLVMAIFVIVVMSLLGAALNNILSAGSDSVAREVVSARALMAAESGAQRKLNEVFPPGGATVIGNCNATTYVMSGLFACTDVAVSCDLVTIDGVNYITLQSIGRCGPTSDLAVRVIDVQAKDG